MNRKAFRRVAAVTLATAAVATLGATTASASTIPDGQFQLCAQGNYAVAGWIDSVPLDDASSTMGMGTRIVNPGDCVIMDAPPTFGRTAPVTVVGYAADGSEFTVGYHGWNSSDGLGLGAQGTPGQHALWSW